MLRFFKDFEKHRGKKPKEKDKESEQKSKDIEHIQQSLEEIEGRKYPFNFPEVRKQIQELLEKINGKIYTFYLPKDQKRIQQSLEEINGIIDSFYLPKNTERFLQSLEEISKIINSYLPEYEKRIQESLKEINEMIDTFYLPYESTSIQTLSTPGRGRVQLITPEYKLRKIKTKIEELKDIKTKLEELREIKATIEELKEIVITHTSYARELSEIEDKIKNLEKNIERAEEKFENLEKEGEEIEKKIANLEKKIKEIEKMVKENDIDTNLDLKRKLRKLERKVRDVERKLRKIEEVPNSDIDHLEREIREIEERINRERQIKETEDRFKDLENDIKNAKERLRKELEYYEELRKKKLERGGYFYIEECDDYLTKAEMEKIINGEIPLFYYHGTKLSVLEFILLQGGLMPQARILLKEAVKNYKKGKISRKELLEKFEKYREEKEQSIKTFKEKVRREIELIKEGDQTFNNKIEELREQINDLEIVKNEEIFNKVSELLRNSLELNLGGRSLTISILLYKSVVKEHPPIDLSNIIPPELYNILYAYYVTKGMVDNGLKNKAKEFLLSRFSLISDGDLGIIRESLSEIGLGKLRFDLLEEEINTKNFDEVNIEKVLKILNLAIDEVKNALKYKLKESLNIEGVDVERIVDEIFEIIRINFLWKNIKDVSPELIKINEELLSLWQDFDKFKDRDKWLVYFGADEPYISRETFGSVLRYTYQTLIKLAPDEPLIGLFPGVVLEFKPSAHKLILWEEIEKPFESVRKIQEIGYEADRPERKLYATNIEYYDNVTGSPIPAAISGRLTYDLITDKKISLAGYLHRIYTSEENIEYVKKLLKEYGLSHIEVCTFEEQKTNHQKALNEIKEKLEKLS